MSQLVAKLFITWGVLKPLSGGSAGSALTALTSNVVKQKQSSLEKFLRHFPHYRLSWLSFNHYRWLLDKFSKKIS